MVKIPLMQHMNKKGVSWVVVALFMLFIIVLIIVFFTKTTSLLTGMSTEGKAGDAFSQAIDQICASEIGRSTDIIQEVPYNRGGQGDDAVYVYFFVKADKEGVRTNYLYLMYHAYKADSGWDTWNPFSGVRNLDESWLNVLSTYFTSPGIVYPASFPGYVAYDKVGHKYELAYCDNVNIVNEDGEKVIFSPSQGKEVVTLQINKTADYTVVISQV